MKSLKKILFLTIFFGVFFLISGTSQVCAEEYNAIQCPPGTEEKKRGIASIDVCYPTSRKSNYCTKVSENSRIEVIESGVDDIYCASPISKDDCGNNSIAPRGCNNKSQPRIPIYGVASGWGASPLNQAGYKDDKVTNAQTAFENGYLIKSEVRYWCKSLKHYLDTEGTNQCYAIGDLVPNQGCYATSGEDADGNMRLEKNEVTIGDFTDAACTTKKSGEGELAENVSVECEIAGGGSGVFTAIGCLPTDPTGIVNWISIFGFYAGGALVVFRIIQGAAQMMTATGNPDKIQEARGIITSAIIGLLVLISGSVLLQFIGVTVLGLESFGFISILID